MWMTGTTHMIARLTGSTLFANHNVMSIIASDHRSLTTANEPTSDNVEKNWNLITKMRDLRARSPYALFIKDNYSQISAKYPDLKLGDISKKIAEVWKSLPDEKKQTYTKKSHDQKVIYEEEKKRLSPSDLQTIDANEKAKRIENRVKKSIEQLPRNKPRSAFAHFLSTLDRGEGDLKDFMRGAAQRWSQMTTQDKQKFENLYHEEKQNYVKALAAWASSNEQTSRKKSRRSSSLTSSKAKDTTMKTTRATSAPGKKAVKRRTTKSSLSPTKSTNKKDNLSSSSSSDDESSPMKKKTSSKSKKT